MSKHENIGGKDIVFEASHSSESAAPKRKSKLEKKEEVLQKNTMGSDFSFVQKVVTRAENPVCPFNSLFSS